MKRHVRFALAALCAGAAAMAAVALAGCSIATGASLVSAGKPALTSAKTVKTAALTTAIDDFGLDLLAATSGEASGNVIVSPASVHAALSMTVNGATGETAQQMRRVLHTSSMSATEANEQWASLLLQLASRSGDQTLEIANSLWARKGIAFKDPFLAADRDYFGAQLSRLDFTTDDVAGAINGWVSKSTHGMITKMINRVPGNAILYLANAVYFKGNWISPFAHEATAKETFTRGDGTKVKVDMMHASEAMPYAQNGVLQATRLTYQGADAAFYVLLPDQGVSVAAAIKSLEGTGFADLRGAMTSNAATEVVLGLPKLDAEYSTSLKKALTSLGMPRAFDGTNAQFGGMASLDVPIYIGDVIHKTKVKVDEKGTEAAAATVVEMEAGAAMPKVVPPRIVCDRPYLFAIVDERSGAMLFLGAVNDPS
jgi:serine protease inhibitor